MECRNDGKLRCRQSAPRFARGRQHHHQHRRVLGEHRRAAERGSHREEAFYKMQGRNRRQCSICVNVFDVQLVPKRSELARDRQGLMSTTGTADPLGLGTTDQLQIFIDR